MSTTFESKDIGFRKAEYVAKTQFLSKKKHKKIKNKYIKNQKTVDLLKSYFFFHLKFFQFATKLFLKGNLIKHY